MSLLEPNPKGFSILAQPQMAMDAADPVQLRRSRQRRSSSFDFAALMQRGDDTHVWPSHQSVTHSHDAVGGPSMSELRRLHGQIATLHASLGELLNSGRFSFREAQGHALRIAESANKIDEMLSGSSCEDTEVDRDLELEKARDSVGEVRAQSTSAARGPRNVDHRRDFESGAKDGPTDESVGQQDSRKRRGHDSALFEFDELMQRY